VDKKPTFYKRPLSSPRQHAKKQRLAQKNVGLAGRAVSSRGKVCRKRCGASCAFVVTKTSISVSALLSEFGQFIPPPPRRSHLPAPLPPIAIFSGSVNFTEPDWIPPARAASADRYPPADRQRQRTKQHRKGYVGGDGVRRLVALVRVWFPTRKNPPTPPPFLCPRFPRQ
jgi:hypothetical protein